jgi:N-acetylgalactosamine-N,N'-diacetylbacillosaminyl-diphospho-undecaprenol 4-alpha-N-acetylgalactosaminyltransferase
VVGRRSPIGYADVTRSFSERFLIRIIYFFCDAAISNSVENVQQGVREGISKNKFKIIPNFLNDPGYIKAHSIEQGPMKLVFIGNFIWYKNQEKFIRALASLEGSQQRFEVTFIGDGPLKEPLQSLASQLRIEATFLGSITNPSSLLRNFDALVLTSLYEGSSNALLEALSHGLPALTSDLLSTRELLNEGAPIVLCNPQDISSIESAIINLEHKFVDLTKISPNFSQKLISKHNPTRIIELWEQTFASLISDK